MEINWPVITLLIGWAGNEVSHHLRSRQTHRTELCRAIAALMELRHILLITEEVITLTAARAKVDRATIAFSARPIFLSKFVSPSTLQSYVKAIEAIAAYDPLLAYDLTGRQRLPEFLSWMPWLSANMPAEAKEIAPVVAKFVSEISDFAATKGVKTIESCIERIAWRASKKLWWQCRRRFRRSEPILAPGSPDWNFVAEKLDVLIKLAVAAGTATVAPPAPHAKPA